MTAFLQNCLNGLSIGSIYALIAIGYTMVYGILRLINFAHGDIFMMAGYFMIICMTDLLIPWYISIILVIAFTVLLGVVIEKVAYKPLRSAPRMSVMISAIGVSYFLQNFVLGTAEGLSGSGYGLSEQNGSARKHFHYVGYVYHTNSDRADRSWPCHPD